MDFHMLPLKLSKVGCSALYQVSLLWQDGSACQVTSLTGKGLVQLPIDLVFDGNLQFSQLIQYVQFREIKACVSVDKVRIFDDYQV